MDMTVDLGIVAKIAGVVLTTIATLGVTLWGGMRLQAARVRRAELAGKRHEAEANVAQGEAWHLLVRTLSASVRQLQRQDRKRTRAVRRANARTRQCEAGHATTMAKLEETVAQLEDTTSRLRHVETQVVEMGHLLAERQPLQPSTPTIPSDYTQDLQVRQDEHTGPTPVVT